VHKCLADTAEFTKGCPMEFSKFSCVFQGNEARARAAALRFEPEHCTLDNVNGTELDRALAGRHLHLMGDSLMRQVFISLGCLLHSAIAEFDIPWTEWTCGKESKPCIKSGPHSGFHHGRIILASGTEIRFDGRKLSSEGGIVVFEQGVHDSVRAGALKLVDELFKLANLDIHALIWMPTPPQAFHTDTAEFNSYELLDLPPGEADLCRPSVADHRRAAETEALRESGAIDLLRAAIVLEGVEHLGHSKVGNGFRSERHPGGDCTHYCMPGVPDEMARVLYNILIAHAHVVR
jgi:hypothetical protein